MFDVSSPRTWAAVATIVATRGLSCARRSACAAATSASSSSPAASAMRTSGVSSVTSIGKSGRIAVRWSSPRAHSHACAAPGSPVGHGLQREEPCRLAAEVRRAVLEKSPCESSRSLLQAPVALMQRDSPQGDDARGVKGADEAIAGLRAELPLEDRAGVGEPAQLVQLPAAPDLEDADRPAVSVALGRRDAVGGQTQRVIHVVQHGARLAAPLLREVLARPVGRADAGARRLLGHLERIVVAPVDIGGDALGEGERERRVGIAARLHGRGRLGVDRLRLLGAAADQQVVEQRGEMLGAQVRRQLGQRERLSAGGDPRIGRDAEHTRDAEEHLGLLLRWQRVAQMRVRERTRLVDAARGMEQDGGLGEQRPAQGVVARRKLERAPAEIGAGPGIGGRERLAGAQQDRDRLLVARLGARRDLRGDLDGRGAGRQEHVGGLAVERPPGRHRDALADGLAGDVVPKGEPVAALDEHPAVDQLLHWPEQCRRGPVEHVGQVGEGEPAAERSSDRRSLSSGRGDAAQALAHRRADATGQTRLDQLCLTGDNADQILVAEAGRAAP